MRLRAIASGFILFQAVASIASAAIIVDIGPNSGTSFRVGGPNSQVEAMSWTQSGAYTGVSISALVGSIDGSSETVSAYLTTSVGPGAGAPIATSSVTVASFANEGAIAPAALFSGLTLNAGSYYLTLFNPNTTGNVNLRWARGTAVAFGAGVSGNGEYFSNATNGVPNTANPWQSTFVTSGLYDNGFTVTGTTVPEPGSLLLVSSALVTLGVASRFRRARARMD